MTLYTITVRWVDWSTTVHQVDHVGLHVLALVADTHHGRFIDIRVSSQTPGALGCLALTA